MDILQVSYGVAATKVMSITGRVVNTPGTTIFWQEIVAISSVRHYVQTYAPGGIASGSLQTAEDIFDFVGKKENVGVRFCPGRVLLIFGGGSVDGGNYISKKNRKKKGGGQNRRT